MINQLCFQLSLSAESETFKLCWESYSFTFSLWLILALLPNFQSASVLLWETSISSFLFKIKIVITEFPEPLIIHTTGIGCIALMLKFIRMRGGGLIILSNSKMSTRTL